MTLYYYYCYLLSLLSLVNYCFSTDEITRDDGVNERQKRRKERKEEKEMKRRRRKGRGMGGRKGSIEENREKKGGERREIKRRKGMKKEI